MILDRFKSEPENPNLDEEYVSRKEFNKLKRLIKTHQYYLDNIHTFYSLEPGPLLVEIRKLSHEMMKFLEKVCDKHDMEYWLDYDTLSCFMGQGEFIPYDDLNVGMAKSDLVKLADIFESEIKAILQCFK